MLKDSPNMGSGTITVKGDKRVVRVGKILRKTKINELPQIINILKGDISLVGPRPLVTKTFFAYNEEVQSKIYNVKHYNSTQNSCIYLLDLLCLIKHFIYESHQDCVTE